MSKNKNEEVYKIGINWYPGHMAKTRREMKEKFSLIDLVYEVIDARMPISSRIHDIQELCLDKKRIVIATKYDLCDRKETDVILDTFQKQGEFVFPVDLPTKDGLKKVIQETQKIAFELNQERAKKGLKARPIRILIMGVPNVGKSTLINQLVGKKATQVGNHPGVTKNLGWIRINKDMELLDSPGILWPKMENQEQAHILASLSSIKEEILDQEDLSYFVLEKMGQLYPQELEKRYGITTFDRENPEDAIEMIARRRGCLSKGGIPDYEKVYSLILKDLKSGAFGKITFDRL